MDDTSDEVSALDKIWIQSNPQNIFYNSSQPVKPQKKSSRSTSKRIMKLSRYSVSPPLPFERSASHLLGSSHPLKRQLSSRLSEICSIHLLQRLLRMGSMTPPSWLTSGECRLEVVSTTQCLCIIAYTQNFHMGSRSSLQFIQTNPSSSKWQKRPMTLTITSHTGSITRWIVPSLTSPGKPSARS